MGRKRNFQKIRRSSLLPGRNMLFENVVIMNRNRIVTILESQLFMVTGLHGKKPAAYGDFCDTCKPFLLIRKPHKGRQIVNNNTIFPIGIFILTADLFIQSENFIQRNMFSDKSQHLGLNFRNQARVFCLRRGKSVSHGKPVKYFLLKCQ